MLPNQASAGVGAVIFDKPTLDAAQVQRNVDADLDNFARKKAADNAKVVAEKNALIADLKFDDKGVFPDDKGYFQGGKEELIKANEKVLMPVSFFIDPEIDKDPYLDDVDTITLSYSFFFVKKPNLTKKN
jgi:hypothetical protein